MPISDPTMTPAQILASLGVTALTQWAALPIELRRKTARAAAKLPYIDTPLSRWEKARVAAIKAGGK